MIKKYRSYLLGLGVLIVICYLHIYTFSRHIAMKTRMRTLEYRSHEETRYINYNDTSLVKSVFKATTLTIEKNELPFDGRNNEPKEVSVPSLQVILKAEVLDQDKKSNDSTVAEIGDRNDSLGDFTPNVQQLEECRFHSTCKSRHSPVKFTPSLNLEDLEEVWETRHRDVVAGGSWKPTSCVSKKRLAVIIPYRERPVHLQLFIKNIIPFFKAQNKSFTIFVVEQSGPDMFNKAHLMNAGFIESQKLGNYDCFVFHDVDMVPINLCNLYDCPEDGARHLGLSRNVTHPHLVYGECIGGASAFNKKIFEKINGFTTVMYGWGGEDDDGYFRLRKLNITVHRYPVRVGNYMQLPSNKTDQSNPKSRRGLDAIWHNKYLDYDGLNRLNYHIINITREHLYTRILVTIHGPRTIAKAQSYFHFMQEQFEEMWQKDNNQTASPTVTNNSSVSSDKVVSSAFISPQSTIVSPFMTNISRELQASENTIKPNTQKSTEKSEVP